MNRIEDKQDYQRLSLCKSIIDIKDLLDVYLKFLFEMIENHHNGEVINYADQDAKMVLQMMFSKIAHIKKVLTGIEYISEKRIKLNNIIDPTIIAVLIRNIYETVAMFNLIYIRTNSSDEKTILYNLWSYSGLKFRQRFEAVVTTDENHEKLEAEEILMQNLISEIEKTQLYNDLDTKNQKIIKQKIKDKDYKICFENKNIKSLSWQDITKVMGFKLDFLEHIYTYFSLYAHPSNVSVFQFSDLFLKKGEPFREMTNFNLRNMFFLISVFVADYIEVFPSTIAIFEKLTIKEQAVIGFHNRIIRGDDYSINNAHKKLE